MFLNSLIKSSYKFKNSQVPNKRAIQKFHSDRETAGGITTGDRETTKGLTTEYMDGSVSVFFAVIMVTLIAFLLSIYDHTRLQMMQAEATANFHLAANQSLSNYDPVLFQEYGLLAGRKSSGINEQFDMALNRSFYPENARTHDYAVDYLLNDNVKHEPFSVNEPDEYQYNLSYIPYMSGDKEEAVINPKKQIVSYVKLREPYLLAARVYSHLDIFSKSRKTSTVIEEKNNIVSGLDLIGDYQKQLYRLVDGIEVFSEGDFLHYEEEAYIRSFSMGKNLDYGYFPESYRYVFDYNVLYFDEFFKFIDEDLHQIDELIEALIEEGPYKQVGGTDEEGIEHIYTMPNPIIDETHEDLKMYVEYMVMYRKGADKIGRLSQSHNKALAIIESYETFCMENVDQINDFQENQLKQSDLLDSAVTQINMELKEIKGEISLEEISVSTVNNLQLIKEQVNNNLLILDNAKPYIDIVCENLENYIYRRVVELTTDSGLEEKEKKLLLDEFKDYKFNESGFTNSVNKEIVVNSIALLESQLSGYDSDLLFDYSGLGELKHNDNYEDKVEKAEKTDWFRRLILENDLYSLQEIEFNQAMLPSHFYKEVDISKNEVIVGNGAGIEWISDESDEDYSWFDFGEGILCRSESFYINEYVVEMFGNAAKSNTANGKSFNGYDVSEHYLKYEAEYVIGGSLDEEYNLNKTLQYLYAMRIGLNSIHLAMDHNKRTMIMEAATMIAGWWTGGVGAIIIAVIIGAFWAILESVADVFLLVSNEKVPLVKTAASWYTALDGNLEELFNGGVRRLENEAMIAYEKGKDNAKELGDKFSQTLRRARDELTEKGYSELGEQIELLEETIGENYGEVYRQQELIGEEIHQQVYDYVDLAMESYLKEPENYSLPESNLDSEFQNIANTIIDQCLMEINELPIEERDLVHIVEIKERVMKTYEQSLINKLEEHHSKFMTIFDAAVDTEIDIACEFLEDALDEKVNLGKEWIHNTADDIKETYLEKAMVENENLKMEFIPEFSYDAYLVLILTLPIVDDDTKVLRIMDLIQMNLMKKYDDYDLSLDDYFYGVEVSGNVAAKSFFLMNVKDGVVQKEWELEIDAYEANYE